jgi:OOP family OmpA-OmpF porin
LSRRIRWSVLLLALGCASPAPSPRIEARPVAPAAGERLKVDRVLVVSDGSLSMGEEGKLGSERALLEAFVAGMPEGVYQAGGLHFGGHRRASTAIDRFERPRLAAWAADVDFLDPTTPLASVVRDSGRRLGRDPGRLALVVFSDGMHSFGPADEVVAAARQADEESEGSLCIYTVQLGSEPEGRALLDALARATGCGAARAGSELATPAALAQFERAIFFEGGRAEAALQADPCAGVLRLRGVNFDFDRATIRPDGAVILDEAAVLLSENLEQCPGHRVSVDGHTDATGPDAYNQALSERRAKAVRDYLVSKGTPAERLRTLGHGESSPIAGNDTREGRALNRRVELRMMR